MGRKLAHDLFIRENFLIYDGFNGANRYVVPLSGIDTVVLYQSEPDTAKLVVMTHSGKLFCCQYELEKAEHIQRTLISLLNPESTQASLGL